MRRVLILAPVLLLAACAGRQRPDQNVPDSASARAVLRVFDQYEASLEGRDLDGLLALVSRDYQDDLGTPEPDDDLDYEALRARLTEDFQQIQSLRLDTEVLRLQLDDDENRAELEYRFDIRYQLGLPSGDKWFNAMDINRMVFQREDEGWKIVDGL